MFIAIHMIIMLTKSIHFKNVNRSQWKEILSLWTVFSIMKTILSIADQRLLTHYSSTRDKCPTDIITKMRQCIMDMRTHQIHHTLQSSDDWWSQKNI